MKVRDLIYLLNTRCKLDDEVYFNTTIENKNDLMETIEAEADDDFLTVTRAETIIGPNNEKFYHCAIWLGMPFTHQIEEYVRKEMEK